MSNTPPLALRILALIRTVTYYKNWNSCTIQIHCIQKYFSRTLVWCKVSI